MGEEGDEEGAGVGTGVGTGVGGAEVEDGDVTIKNRGMTEEER